MSNQTPNEKKSSGQLGPLTTPLSQRGWPTWIVYVLSLAGLVYLINPTGGIAEFIPDLIPGIGNIDEGVAMMMVWAGLVEFFEGRKLKKTPPAAADGEVIDGEVINK